MERPSSRERTRDTLVSTTPTSTRYANARIARAVYAPTPGSASRSASSVGTRPLCRSTIAVAACCRFRHRRGYPSPCHRMSASPRDARARSTGAGNVSMNASNFGTTRDTEVCWSITSLTSTDHGSCVRLHGRSRRDAAPHERSAETNLSSRPSRPTRPVRRRDGGGSGRIRASRP